MYQASYGGNTVSSPVNEQKEFEQILNSILSSSINPKEAERLEALMQGHPERMSRYLEATEFEVMLDAEAAFVSSEQTKEVGTSIAESSDQLSIRGTSTVDTVERLTVKSQSIQLISLPNILDASIFVISHISKFKRSAAALLFIALVSTLGWWASSRRPMIAVYYTQNTQYQDSSVAFQTGDSLEFGKKVHLLTGKLGLQTRSGVTLVAEGPAEFCPLKNGDFALSKGKLRVQVSKEAAGFAVHCPGIKVTDLGTEFGVLVSDSGQVETEVYAGTVRMELAPPSDKPPIDLQAGWAGSGNAAKPVLLEAYEIRSRQSRFKWWTPSQVSMSKTLSASPELYFRFDFPANGSVNSLVNSKIYSAELSGDASFILEGPRSTMKSDGKSLQLRGNGFAEIPIGFAATEQTDAYTFSVWMKTEVIGSQSVFLTTNHLGPGQRVGPQLRIRADGTLEHHLFNPTQAWGTNPPRQLLRSREPVSLKRWRHVVISAATSGQMMLYVDGQQAADPVPTETRIAGAYPRILLGSSASKVGYAAYVGLLDEFAFFNRQLTEEEILTLFESSCLCFEERN